ncbi:MAG: SPOR domain-containing protein [Bacteroidetes bacterium]|nr:SPOR domain-containing protein [Bacteroidota bacterium]
MKEVRAENRKQESEWIQSDSNSKFYILHALFLLYFSVNFSCLAQKNKPYHEDLSKLRPHIELPTEKIKIDSSEKIRPLVTPVKTVNAKVDAVLDSIDRFNLTRKFIDGYTIQIYSGQKREDAMNAKQKLMEEVEELQANLKYEQPKFKVTVGQYFTQLEAQHDLLLLKKIFSTASLVPEKIMMK